VRVTFHYMIWKRNLIYNVLLKRNFFQSGDLPEITDLDKQLLDRLKAGYFNLIKYPPLLEDTVKMAVLGPLLYFAGFYLYPFHTKSEYSVKISNRDGDVIVEGKIDVLVLKEQFWIMVIESKQAAFSIEAGLAQILADMLANKIQKNLALV